MKLSLTDLFNVVKELKAIYDPIAGKSIGVVDGLSVARQVIAVLVKYQITLQDLDQILSEFAPFIAMAAAVKG